MAKRSTASAKNKKSMDNSGSLGGFTIIEVVLVLAIAGLIFLMVFIAFPQLARSQRDTQRQQDLASLNSAIIRFQGNNNGKLPKGSCTSTTEKLDFTDTGDSSACRLIKSYLHGVNDTENHFVDPQGTPYKLVIDAYDNKKDLSLDKMDNTIYMVTGATCDGESVKSSNNPRDFALLYRLEGSGVYCHGNNG